VEREREGLALMASAGLTADLLPILDDLERAMSTVAPELRAYTWVDGVWFIAKKLEALLAAHGLEEIKAQGQPFDPQRHQAVAEAEGEPGQVLKVAQKGYRLQSLLLRPALVTVGKRPSPEGAAKAAPGGDPRETQGEPPKAAS
jgi:molecular chaperone GrpE